MADPARRRATYQDVLDAPPNVVAEVIDGVLYTHPRPRLRHAAGTSMLGVLLGGPFWVGDGGGPGGWVLLDEPELHLGADIVVPDLGGWRRERLPEIPDEPYVTLAPDWICEGLSKSTEKLDRGAKMDIYAREGVKHAWLLDVRIETLEVYRLEKGLWVRVAVHEGNARVRIEPFDAIELPLGRLWER